LKYDHSKKSSGKFYSKTLRNLYGKKISHRNYFSYLKNRPTLHIIIKKNLAIEGKTSAKDKITTLGIILPEI